MFKKIAIAVVLVFTIAIIFMWPKISLYLAGNKVSLNTKSIDFYFKVESGLPDLAEKLFQQKIIDDKDAFMRVGEYKELDSSRLASGKYVIQANSNYKTLLNGFTKNANGNGNAEVEVKVTFNNCRDIYQMAGRVDNNLMIDSAELVQLITSDEFLKKYDFTLEQLPALFLPNTYNMFWDSSCEQFVERMIKEFKSFWTDERKSKLEIVGLKSPSQAVTLASVVYSEQGRVKEEWPVIAGLYLNRLKKGIRLQSDPTFKFCWGDKLDGVQRLTYEHRDIDCPYNTYYNNGLPPGPICIPPSAVVDAVLNPDKNDYIFMIAKPDYSGQHDFSVDYARHAKLAKTYQQWLAKEQENRN
jgi:UPF0755 protein